MPAQQTHLIKVGHVFPVSDPRFQTDRHWLNHKRLVVPQQPDQLAEKHLPDGRAKQQLVQFTFDLLLGGAGLLRLGVTVGVFKLTDRLYHASSLYNRGDLRHDLVIS